MDSNKLCPAIFNVVADNLVKLAALFPAAVKDGQLDIAALREELGQFEEVGAEKYELTWAGKQAAKKLSQTDVAGRTLKYVPEDSKDPDTTQNLYIEGDNLEVLKLLRQNYYGAVKMIYIDPPYNTGNDFVYRDNFTQSHAESAEAEGETVNGERMVVNQKSSNRFHANWLNMMYPRLRVAKDLLREDGVIFVSIDDNEAENLKKVCDEIFGSNNYQATITYVRKTSGKQDSTNFMKSTEYIICYSKSSEWECAPIIADSKVTDRYNKADDNGRKYRETDLRKTGSGDRREDRPLMFYPFYYNIQKNELLVKQKQDNTLKKMGYTEIFPVKPDGTDGRWRWGYTTSVSNLAFLVARIMPKYRNENKYTVYEIDYIDKNGNVRTVVEHTSWDRTEFNSDNAMLEFKNLGFSNQLFPFPKSSALMGHIVYLANTSDDDTILDFFSGSATTAHAVMQRNAEDKGSRKFIMVQYPEICDENSEAAKADYSNICQIGKERIRRAGKKIKTEIERANAQLQPGEEPNPMPDIGFRVFRVAGTNIRWTREALKGGQMTLAEGALSDKDRLDFMPGFTDLDVVYEILLRQRDIPLSAKVEKLGIGKRAYMFADAYVVCLDESVSAGLVEELAAVEPAPIQYVLRDSAFDDNISLKDETLRRLEAYIARNSGELKKTYTVEFI